MFSAPCNSGSGMINYIIMHNKRQMMKMKKNKLALLLALVLLLTGCGGENAPAAAPNQEASTEAMQTEPAATVPPDGNPEDVTCKGSYTAQVSGDAVVAQAGDAKLTNSQLQVWYWAEVAQYQQEQHETAPDFSKPLDSQVCEIDDSVASWQQYFLREALNAWHSAQALTCQSEEVPMPTEEAYQPNLKNHETYMTGMPATKYLYGYNELYQVNTLHQEYLDSLSDTLDALAEEKGYADAAAMAQAAFGTGETELEDYAQIYNRAYMYFTAMSYYIEPTEEELAEYYEKNKASFQDSGSYVDLRQILLIPENIYQPEDKTVWRPASEATEPILLEEVQIGEDGKVTCSEEAWLICEEKAQALLKTWEKNSRKSEATFAELAQKNSQDTGTALDGGAYHRIRKGQLTDVLDAWCFDAARMEGDIGILRSAYGVHILYFAGKEEIAQADAKQAYIRQQQNALITEAREAHPMKADYSSITLGTAEGSVAAGDILYADIAHERFPEVPLYLQQDYPNTKYGGFKITSNGCGITTMAMLASYMADDELTPPEMCARYGRYSHANGTDGMIFNYEPAVMGFYLREKTYDTRVAKAALEEGQIVISIQHPGYWTRGGHYIVCESITEDGMVQVRDSNIYNYVRVPAHKEDLHKWGNITAAGSGYWVFEDKITNIPACSRCGTDASITESLLTEDYVCHKCQSALLRRNTYLACE